MNSTGFRCRPSGVGLWVGPERLRRSWEACYRHEKSPCFSLHGWSGSGVNGERSTTPYRVSRMATMSLEGRSNNGPHASDREARVVLNLVQSQPARPKLIIEGVSKRFFSK